MAAVSFPDLKPSARTYSPGRVPLQEFTGQNGAVTAVKFGNRLVDSALSLTFQNITDEEAFDIWTNYSTVNGGVDDRGNWNYIEFPREDAGAMAGIQFQSMRAVTGEYRVNRRYRYAITSHRSLSEADGFPGRCTVTIKLRGYLDGPNN